MANRSFIRQPDAEFIARVATINARCAARAEAWGIDAGSLARLQALTAAAQTAYEANSDRARRNLLTAIEKKNTFEELKQFLSLFAKYLEGNLKVPDEDVELMGLPSRVRRKRLPLPAPDQPPALSVVRQHNELILYVARQEHGQPLRGARPANCYGFKLRWRFADETIYNTEISTRLKLTLRFRSEDETRRVVLAVAWINPRLQEGPWSKDLIEVVG